MCAGGDKVLTLKELVAHHGEYTKHQRSAHCQMVSRLPCQSTGQTPASAAEALGLIPGQGTKSCVSHRAAQTNFFKKGGNLFKKINRIKRINETVKCML